VLTELLYLTLRDISLKLQVCNTLLYGLTKLGRPFTASMASLVLSRPSLI